MTLTRRAKIASVLLVLGGVGLGLGLGLGLTGNGGETGHDQIIPLSPPLSRTPATQPGPVLSEQILLHTNHVVAGTEIKGTLVVTNRGHSAIKFYFGCPPYFVVGLTGPEIPPGAALPAVAAPACSGSTPIKPGKNRFALTVSTTYTACEQTRSEVTKSDPACGSAPNLAVPLPAGRYQAVISGNPSGLPKPPPVVVTLVAAPRP